MITPIDLEDIESRIADGIYGDDRMTSEERNDAFSALAEVLAEVERLRHDLADLQRLRDEHMMDNLHAYEEGGHAERAAVVAWLERQGGRSAWTLVESVRKGEHRKGEP